MNAPRYGLTKSGKVRTRPLRNTLMAALPPAMCREAAPGYIYYEGFDSSPQNAGTDSLGIWVYLDDFDTVISVAREVSNGDYTSRHGTRTTKNKGCNGPLCLKALRDDLYGGARSMRLKRLEELLSVLQEKHNEQWVRKMSPDERARLAETIEKYVESANRRLELVRAS